MVRLSRRVAFCAGHRYWFADLSEEENFRLFGDWASPYNHGHNYALWVTTEGVVDPETGMVVNIKRIDDLLQERIVTQFDAKSVNDEIPWFARRSPSLENLALYMRQELAALPPEARLVALRLEETDTLWTELERTKDDDWTMTLTRSYEFAASHRLHAPALTAERNLELYGKCNNPAGHGHNYVLEVTVEGWPDEETGMMVSIDGLDATVQELVVDRYDHRNLNEDLPEFAGKVTTSEVVAQQIWDSLNGKLPAKLHRVRLYETPRNVFEVTG